MLLSRRSDRHRRVCERCTPWWKYTQQNQSRGKGISAMSHAEVPATTPSPTTAAIQTRLSGRWLWLARVVWLSAAALLIASFLLTLPLTYAQVQQICTGAPCEGSLRPEDLPVLAAWGLSPAFIAASGTVLVGLVDLVWIVMGLLLFVRRSAEPHILFFSLCLLLFGG